MRSTKLHALVALALGLALAIPAAAADKPSGLKNKYQAIEIVRFDVKEGVEFPADFLLTMTEELVTQLKQTRKFKEVLRQGETPAIPDAATLRLTGTVTEYKKGSRAKRYLVGFGAGKTKVVAHVKWADRATGQVLFEDDVDGKVVMGAFGGESTGATRGLAKEVAGVTKKNFF